MGLDGRSDYRYVSWLLGFCLLLALLVPAFAGAYLLEMVPRCPYARLGVPCDGCGLTRSIVAFYRGEFAQSLAFHEGGPSIVLAAAAQLGLRPVTGRLRVPDWLPWLDLGQLFATVLWLGVFCVRR